ncbi:HEPN domain-containing protein [Mesorhizobium sp.]|uniref:HEPN domain-containing protein n=1 Tax=Mesorhizobium sp. TaxID=1871066 RepID=UPI000FEA082C|nr:HEPN domain-containing protein [Mesorhizobium sp.]RWP41170.1 MAG: hypothetical protein EOR05_31605 [Mesorhizobium sp.]
MAGGQNSKQGDKELVDSGQAFLKAFLDSAAKDGSPADFAEGSGISIGEAGVVEITEEVAKPLGRFVLRAAQVLGSAAGHEKAIYQTALNQAHALISKAPFQSDSAKALIKAVFEQGQAHYKYVTPNHLYRLTPGVDEIKIGPVRALPTQEFSKERKAAYPDDRVEILPASEFAFQFVGTKVVVHMYQTCWVVDVGAIAENVEEEGKWLIDVAVSYLRLCHKGWQGHFPDNGMVESHPTRVSTRYKEGVKFDGSRALAGGHSLPTWYEIDAAAVATTADAKFISNAELIFAAPKKGLAERVSQGLGWLTRGRQADERAERLLYFFTAIEALLSNDDKTAPVVQTIARHGAVLLCNNNAQRAKIATQIKKLYSYRSALVHTGNRSILWSAANESQILVESMLHRVLQNADLKITHGSFCDSLSEASYGTAWPASMAGERPS